MTYTELKKLAIEYLASAFNGATIDPAVAGIAVAVINSNPQS